MNRLSSRIFSSTVLATAMLLLSGGSVLATCNTDPDGDGTADYQDVSGVCVPLSTGLSDAAVSTILINLMKWLLGIFGFVAIIGFVVSGLQYVSAAGDEKQIETAKGTMKYSIIGIAVGLSGYIIITAIDTLLSGTTAVF